MKYITSIDFILTPLYLIIIYAFLSVFVKSQKNNFLVSKYFLTGISLKFLGAISLGLIYQFYYGDGDTFSYFKYARIIHEAFNEDFDSWLKLVFGSTNYDADAVAYASRIRWYREPSSYFIVRIVAFLNPFCFGTYSVIALMFALISFSGVWHLFLVFTHLYPHLHKKFAIAILYFPSVIFWGSGILKDPIALTGLGWLLYSFYFGLLHREKVFKCVILFLLSALILLNIKTYIIFSFAPLLLFWLLQSYSNNIRNRLFRYLFIPVSIFVGIILSVYSVRTLTSGTAYDVNNLDNIAEEIKSTGEGIYFNSKFTGGAGYYLGELDGTFAGTLRLAPAAINVSLFRPYIWEVRNIVMLLSALESAFLLFLALKIMFKPGIRKVLGVTTKTPVVTLCIVFSLVFAFFVGVSSFNFGTLVRYRLPLLPFFLSALFILESYSNKPRKLA